MNLVPSMSAVGTEPLFGRDELVRLDRVSLWFSASPSGVVGRAGSAPGFRPGGRVTFFWAQKKVTKEEASMPSSKGSQPCGPALDARGGGWTGRGASSVERGPERLLLVVGGRTASDHPDPVRWQGRGACGDTRRAQVHDRPQGPISVPSCPASSSGSCPRSTLLVPRPIHPPPRESQAMPEARDSLELGIQALFFGDFLLGPEESYPPAGRNPARCRHAKHPPTAKPRTQVKLGHCERAHRGRTTARPQRAASGSSIEEERMTTCNTVET